MASRGCRRRRPITNIAVVAHTGAARRKRLKQLPEILAAEGAPGARWHEVDTIGAVAGEARSAAGNGADVVFACGSDGTVRSCIEGLAHTETAMAIVPAGTANLLAANLGIPTEPRAAVRTGLRGSYMRMDTGLVNGERFAVMAGAGGSA